VLLLVGVELISDIISREILRLHILFNGTDPFWSSGRHSLVQWWLLACGERCSVAWFWFGIA
jgi:hypothetical protein